jgi:hypothetical protein
MTHITQNNPIGSNKTQHTKLHNITKVHNGKGHILHIMNTITMQLQLHLQLKYKYNSQYNTNINTIN